MSEFEYIRQTTLRSIKKAFLQHCNLSNNEAIKVWTNWVIANHIREKQIDEFLPTENLELDNKTVSLLIEKGIPEDDAMNFYANFIQQCQRWKYRYQYYKSDSALDIDENAISITLSDFQNNHFPPGFPIQLTIETSNLADKINNTNLLGFSVSGNPDKKLPIDAGLATFLNEIITINADLNIDYRGLSNKIDAQSLLRLLNCYASEISCIKFQIWKLLNTYNLLDGLSYQWSLPPETFDLLVNSCNLKAELFASPLNHHAKNYYSLFEIDKAFGSSGDFFKSTYKDFSAGGFYEANPPFIDSIFIQASHLIFTYLEYAKEDKIDLAFMWIMPDWLDSFAYKRLKANKFLRTELILRKGQHKYWEYRKNRVIQANFNTHVLIFSSNEEFYQRIWPPFTESAFNKTMVFCN